MSHSSDRPPVNPDDPDYVIDLVDEEPAPQPAPVCPLCGAPLAVVDGLLVCDQCGTVPEPPEEPEPSGKCFQDDEIIHIDPAEEDRRWSAFMSWCAVGMAGEHGLSPARVRQLWDEFCAWRAARKEARFWCRLHEQNPLGDITVGEC